MNPDTKSKLESAAIGYASLLASTIAPQIPAQVAYRAGIELMPDDSRLRNVEVIRRFLRRRGVSVISDPTAFATAVYQDPVLQRLPESIRTGITKQTVNAGPLYASGIRTIFEPMGKSPILAHEAGHAVADTGLARLLRSPKLVQVLSRLAYAGQPVAGISGLVSALSPNERTGAVAAGLGTAAALPMLASELHASEVGRRLLRRTGIGGGGRAYLGVPTYAAIAAVPGLTYLIKKKLRGYRD